jgi:hypothetical protein
MYGPIWNLANMAKAIWGGVLEEIGHDSESSYCGGNVAQIEVGIRAAEHHDES